MIAGLYKAFDHWHKRGTVWIYSDPHFGDKELQEKIKRRPSDLEQVRNINSKVGKHDTLIILGDVGDIKYARMLKGYKVLLLGNHDHGVSYYEDVFDEVYSGPLFIGERVLLSHEPIDFDYALNIHGHLHFPKKKYLDDKHFNVCAEAIDYMPINFNQLIKSGRLAHIQSIHRKTINRATERKRGK